MKDEKGKPEIDDSFFLLVNASADTIDFTLPTSPSGTEWHQVLDTANIGDPFNSEPSSTTVTIPPRSLRLFCDRAK